MLETALRLKPGFAEWYQDLGTILAKAGRATEAAACFEKVLALQPGHARAAAELARLRSGVRQ